MAKPIYNLLHKLALASNNLAVKKCIVLTADEKHIIKLNLQSGDKAWLWNKPDSNDVLVFCKGFGIAAEKLGVITNSKLYRKVINGKTEVKICWILSNKVAISYY